MSNYRNFALLTGGWQSLRWLVTAIVMMVAIPLEGAVVNWTGGGADTNWSTVANWSTNPALPAVGDTVVFATAGTSVTMDSPRTVASITFSSAGDFTIGGASTLTVTSAAAMTVSGGANFFITCPLALGATQTWTHGGTGTVTVSGVVSGAFGLAKAGTGTLVLSGANSYTGTTTISAGTLVVGHATALGTTAGATSVTAGAVLQLDTVTVVGEALTLNGTGIAAGGALIGSGVCGWTGTVALGSASSIGGTGAGTLNGIVSGANALTKVGSGSWTLSGANTYTGITTVSVGTLVVDHATALGTTAGATTVTSGAVLQLNAFTITGEGLTLNGSGIASTGALVSSGVGTWTGTVAQGSASTINVGNSTTISGVVSGAFALTKIGSGTLVLTGTNTTLTSLNVNEGTVRVGGGLAIPNTTAVILANTAGVVLDLNGTTETIGSLAGGGATGGDVTLGAGTLITGDATSTAYAGIISGTGAVTKAGAGTWTVSGANTYSGLTTVSVGTLVVDNLAALGTTAGATTVTSGAVLDLAAFTIVDEALTLNGTGIATNGALIGSGVCGWTGTVALGSNSSIGGTGTGTLSNVISGAFALTKVGSGTWILTATNTFTGTLTVNGGTVQVAGGNAIPDTCNVTLANTAGVVLDLNGTSETIGSLATGGATGGDVLLGAGALTTGNATSTTYGGIISGSGTVTKVGAGTWTVSGANTYTGLTTVSAGVLAVSSPQALGTTAAGTVVTSPAALLLNATGVVVGEALSIGGTGSGTGALLGAGSGGSWSGPVTLTAATSVGGTGNVSTISGVISGGFALTKSGNGAWTLSGANTYNGLTTVGAGTLSAQHATALGTATFGTTVSTNATLDLGPVTVTGENLLLNGPGASAAAGALSATGVGGVWTGPVTMLSASSIGGTGSATISGTLGGGQNLSKFGTGSWTLSAANGYSGTTVVNAGTLVVAHAQALGTTGATAGTTVNSGAILQVGAFNIIGEGLTLNGIGDGVSGALATSGTGSWSGTVALASNTTITVAGTTTFSGVVSGAFTLTKGGVGEARLSAVNTFSGLTIAAGGVRLSGGAALSDAAIVNLADVAGVTLDLAGVSETIGALGGGGTNGGVVTLGAGTLTTGTTGSPTFGGVIGGSGGLNITGSGTMTLTATSTYNGATTITGATVVLSGDVAAIPQSVSLTLSGGSTLSIPGVGTVNPNRIADSATVTMQSATISMSAAGFNRSETIGGLIFASGANVITLVPNGTTNTTILTASGYGHTAGATLTFNPTDAMYTKLFFTSATDGEVLGWSTVTHPTTGVGQYSFANGLVVAGSSKVTAQLGDWSNGATWSPVGVPLASDTVQVLHAVDLTTDQTVVSVAMGPGGSIAAPSGRRTLTITSGSMQVSGASSPTIDANLSAGSADVLLQHDGTGTLTMLGAISGGNLGVSAGAATVRLQGANLHSGTTTVLSGILVVANPLALASTTAGTRVADGAALVLDGVAVGAEALIVRGIGPGGIGALGATGTSSATGAITLQAATSIGGSGTLSLGGIISGAFALTKVGSGTVVLTGANTYSGGTTVDAGTLQAIRLSLPGAVVNNATLAIIENGTGTYTAGVTGPGNFEKLGTGTLILVSPTLIAGTTTVTQGTLQLNSLGSSPTSDTRISGPVVNNATLAFNHVLPAFPANNTSLLYAGIISGSGTLTKMGDGVLELNGANTFTGTTTISAGTLRVSADVVDNVAGALGNSAAAITIAGGVLEVNTANVSRPLIIGATGGRIDAYGSARTVSSPITVSAVGTGGGLTSSIVAASLRSVLIDDWRTTFSIAGTRIDPLVNYPLVYFGTTAERAAFGIAGTDAGGSASGWDSFSSQWDGYLRVVTTNTSIFIRADDTVRMWIDVNNNSVQDVGELIVTTGTTNTPTLISGALPIGTYRIRLQYEEGTGGNYAQLLWSDLGNSAGAVAPVVLIPAAFFSGFSIGGVPVVGASGQTLTLAGTISGTGSLSKIGTSTALLNAGNTYAGGTYVLAGTLRSGAVDVIPNQALVVDALATVDLANFPETVGGLSGRGSVTLGNATLSVGSGNGAGTFAGDVSGGGGITKLGTGTQVFSGANSYLGTTQVSAGVLVAADPLALGDAAGATVVDNGGSLEVSGITITAENLTLNGLGDGGSGALRGTDTAVVGGTIDLASATSVVTTGDLTLAGEVSGVGAWSLSGGIITLSTSNSFTGITTVASGTVVIGDDAALGTIAGGTVVSSGATLALTGATIVSEGLTLSGAGVGGVGALSNDIDGFGAWTGDIVLAANATIGGTGTTTTLSGVISGSGGLTKAGSGTYFLSGSNTFTGATTIGAGTMTLVGDNGSIAASSSVLIGTGANLVFDPSGAANPDRIGDTVDVTFTGGTLTIQAPASVSCTETVGSLVIASGANLIDLHPTLTLPTQLTATTGFSQTSPATFTLDRNVLEGTANLFLGGVGNGTVFTWSNVIETGTAIGRYSLVDGLVGISGGFYTIADGLWTTPATWFGGNVPGAGDVVDVRHAVALDSNQGVVSLGISLDGQIIIDAAVRRQLTIGAGTVTIANNSSAPLIDADLAFGSVDAVIRQDAAVTASIVGVISGSGSVTKTGAGTLTLEGANTYSGATQIAAGTVILAHANALGTTGAGTTVDSGASLDLDDITLAAEALVLSGNGPGGLGAFTSANTAGTTGTIALAADASIGGSGTLTLAGVVSGSGRLSKVGSGTVTLSAVNTYSGGTTITAGTLRGAANAFPGNIIDQATLEFAELGTGTYAFLISGSGDLRKTGSGTLILSGLSTYTGTTTIEAGILRVTGDVVAGAPGPLGSGNTAVDLAGGSLESATTTVSRPLLISAAGVRIDAIGTARTIASPISASGPQIVTVGNSTGVTPTFSGAISDGVGTLALIKDGTNTVILTGANTYSGGTTVSAGTLQGSATGLQGNIANAAALIFDQTGVAAFSGLISGAGTVTKIGTGTVVMGAANTYTGLTTIVAGSMRASTDVVANTAGPFGLSAAAVELNGGGIESDTDVFSRPITVAAAGGQLDAYGTDRTVSAPITLANGGPGMTASIVSSSMRAVTQDDWRLTQTIIGTRIDPQIYNPGSSFGTATEFATYAVNGTTAQWEEFSIQYDGWVSVLVPNTVIYTASDDGSRAWVDANQNNVVDSGEWMNNGWGAGQGITARPVSPPLAPGLYRIRVQFEQATGGAGMSLMWNDATNSGGAYLTYHVIPTARFAPFQVGGTTVVGATGQTMTLTGVIDGANAGVQKVGTSTVVLAAANTYGGSTMVQGGTLRAGIVAALPPTPLAVLATATCDLADFDQTVGALSGIGGLSLGAGTISVASDVPSLFEGVISGSGGLTKLGTAKLTLSATSLFTGPVQVTTGTLSVRSAAAFGGGTTDVTIADGAGVELVGVSVAGRTLIVNGVGVGGVGALQASGTSAWSGPVTLASASTITSSGALTLDGVLSGSATLTSNGAGSVTLSGTNTWTGDLVIAAGMVAVSGGAAIDDLASVTLADVAGAVFATNASETIGDLSGGGGLGGNVSLGTSTLTLGGTNAATTFAGAMSGTGALVKNGSGTFTLSGTSTASGPTTLSGGELAITGTILSSVTAANNTTLSGSGLLGVGTLSQTILRPGVAGPGTLTLSDLNLSATSILEFELGTASDRVVVVGNGVVDGTLTVAALSGFGIGTYPLFTIGGTVTDQGIDIDLTNMPDFFTYQIVTTPTTVSLVVGAQTVQVAATVADASEAGLDPGEFTITRTGTHGNLVVAYTLGGTATEGTDYDDLSGTVTIPDGATSAIVTITPIDDQATIGFASATQSAPGGSTTVTIPVVLSGIEADPETIILTIDPSSTYALGTTTSATVNLADDDQSVASLDVSVDFAVTGLYPELGDAVVTASPVVILAGNTSTNIIITLAATPWSNRTFTATLSSPVNASLGIATQVVTLPAVPDPSSNSPASKCGLGSGLTAMLLMAFALLALRWRRE